jgi:hypothetical protein
VTATSYSNRPQGPLGCVPFASPSKVPSQLLFREVNEQIALRLDRPPGCDLGFEAVCECDRRGCARSVQLSVAQYEAVRQFPTRFVMRPGHSNLEDERVVEAHETYVVVEKIGPSAQIAIRLDPRKRRLQTDRAA